VQEILLAKNPIICCGKKLSPGGPYNTVRCFYFSPLRYRMHSEIGIEASASGLLSMVPTLDPIQIPKLSHRCRNTLSL
jgi:hypothetical protein